MTRGRQSWRQLSCLPQDYYNSESKVFILFQPVEYTNTERLDQYVIIIYFIFIPLARTWLYVPINLQGRFWKCSVYLNIHLPSKNYDFLKSIIKEEECGYLWWLAGSAKWRSSHYQITTDLLLLLLIPFWGSNFSNCWLGSTGHGPFCFFVPFFITAHSAEMVCAQLLTDTWWTWWWRTLPCRRGLGCLLMLVIDLVWVSSSRIHSPKCPQEKFISSSISFANLVSFVWLLFYSWTSSEHVKRRNVLSAGHFWTSTSWSKESKTFMFSPKKKKKKRAVPYNEISLLF